MHFSNFYSPRRQGRAHHLRQCIRSVRQLPIKYHMYPTRLHQEASVAEGTVGGGREAEEGAAGIEAEDMGGSA
jgi:hypothetical protein